MRQCFYVLNTIIATNLKSTVDHLEIARLLVCTSEGKPGQHRLDLGLNLWEGLRLSPQ